MVALGLEKNLLQIKNYRTTGLSENLLNEKEKKWATCGEKTLATNMMDLTEHST